MSVCCMGGCRSRNKALQREHDDLDDLQEQYLSLLDSLNPRAAGVYRDKEAGRRSPKAQKKKKKHQQLMRNSGSERQQGDGCSSVGEENELDRAGAHLSSSKHMSRQSQEQPGSLHPHRNHSEQSLGQGQWKAVEMAGGADVEEYHHTSHRKHMAPAASALPPSRRAVDTQSVEGEGEGAARISEEGTRRDSKWPSGWTSAVATHTLRRDGSGSRMMTEVSGGGEDVGSDRPPDLRNSKVHLPTKSGHGAFHEPGLQTDADSGMSLVNTDRVEPRPTLSRTPSREFRNVRSAGIEEQSPSSSPVIIHPVDVSVAVPVANPTKEQHDQPVSLVQATAVTSEGAWGREEKGGIKSDSYDNAVDSGITYDNILMPPPSLLPQQRESKSQQSTVRLSQTGNMSIDSLGAHVTERVSVDAAGGDRLGSMEFSSNQSQQRELGRHSHKTTLSADMLDEHVELFERSDTDLTMSLSVSQAPEGTGMPVLGGHALKVVTHDDDIKDFSMQLDDSLVSEAAAAENEKGTGMVLQDTSQCDTPPRSVASRSRDDNDHDAKFGRGEKVEVFCRQSWREGSVVDVTSDNTYRILIDPSEDGKTAVEATGISSSDIRSLRRGDIGVTSPGGATMGRALKSDVVNFLQHRHSADGSATGDDESADGGMIDNGEGHSFGSHSEGDAVLMGTNKFHTYGDTVSSLDSPVQRVSPLVTPSGKEATSSPFASGVASTDNYDDNQEDAVPTDGDGEGKSVIKWTLGRAPLELVETGYALDVFVSAVRFDASAYDAPPTVSSPISRNYNTVCLSCVLIWCVYMLCIRFLCSCSSWESYLHSLSPCRQACVCLSFQLASQHVSSWVVTELVISFWCFVLV